MTVAIEPLERRSYEAAWLMATHPPVFGSANKRVVFHVACPAGCARREGRVLRSCIRS